MTKQLSQAEQLKKAHDVPENRLPIFNNIGELENFAKTAPVTLTVLEVPPMVDENGAVLEPDAPQQFMVGLGVVLPNGMLVGGVMAYEETFNTMEEAAAVAKALSEGDETSINKDLISEYAIGYHLTPTEPRLDVSVASYVMELEGSLEIGDFALNHLSVPVVGFVAQFPDAIKAKQQYDIYAKNHSAFQAHRENRRTEVLSKLQETINKAQGTAEDAVTEANEAADATTPKS